MSEADANAARALADRIILVTGASHGLGRAVALAAAAAGGQVIATGRNRAALEERDDAARQAGTALTLLPLDLLEGEQVDRLGPSIFQRFGRLDAFCHCAAELGLLTRVTDIAPDRLERVFATNVFATQRLLRTLDPLFRASQSPSIVAVTDSAAIGKRAFWGHYAASKCAMEVLVRAYAAENEFRSLTVNLVDPGPMATRLRAEAYPGEAKDAQPAPETIADKILPLLAADAAQHEGTVGLRN